MKVYAYLIEIVLLTGGRGLYEGRVEVYYNGQWGTVCDNKFDIRDADVLCKQLGYRSQLEVYGGAHFGQGSGPIWLDNLACTGTEISLLNCSHNGIGIHNCGHNQDAGVTCQGTI